MAEAAKLFLVLLVWPQNAEAGEASDLPGFELGALKCPKPVVRRSAEDHGGGGHGVESTPAPPAVLYLPLGGSGRPSCLPSAGAKLAQLVSLSWRARVRARPKGWPLARSHLFK